MNRTNAVRIFNDIADGKDGTLDTMGYDLPAHGYFVGGQGEPLVFESAEEANLPGSLNRIARFVEDTEARFIGWWTDKETGKVWVDGTTWHIHRTTAFHAALQRGEIAFWDIKRDRELRLAYAEGE